MWLAHINEASEATGVPVEKIKAAQRQVVNPIGSYSKNRVDIAQVLSLLEDKAAKVVVFAAMLGVTVAEIKEAFGLED